MKIIGHPTWKNTLNQETVNRDCYQFMDIGTFAIAAFNLNYPYICWNDRVYAISKNENFELTFRDTNLLVGDVL